MLAYNAFLGGLGPHGFPLAKARDPLANAPGSGFGFKGRSEPVWDQVEIERERVRKEWVANNGGKDADTTGAHWVVDEVGG